MFIINRHYSLSMPEKKQKPIRLKKDYDLIEDLHHYIEKIKDSGVFIIVEGVKDKDALRELGILNVFALNRMPLYKVVEIVAKKAQECMILTDLDSEGKKLYAKLNHDLQRHGVRVDNSFREFLFRHTSLRQIEGISKYIRRIGNLDNKL